ncbi:hypothetical protein [Chamaesiphon sp.]
MNCPYPRNSCKLLNPGYRSIQVTATLTIASDTTADLYDNK